MKKTAVLTLCATLALGGCDAGTGPDDRDLLSSEDVDALAGFLSEMDVLVAAAMATTTTGTRTFTRTASCPAGGTISASGTSETTRNDSTRIVSTKWSNTQTQTACTITRTKGDRTWTAVIDGKITGTGSSSWMLPETRGGQRTLLSWTATRVGSTTTTVGDRTNTCEMNVTETYDPAKNTVTISGVMCGRQVSITRDWGKSGG